MLEEISSALIARAIVQFMVFGGLWRLEVTPLFRCHVAIGKKHNWTAIGLFFVTVTVNGCPTIPGSLADGG